MPTQQRSVRSSGSNEDGCVGIHPRLKLRSETSDSDLMQRGMIKNQNDLSSGRVQLESSLISQVHYLPALFQSVVLSVSATAAYLVIGALELINEEHYLSRCGTPISRSAD